MSTTAEQKLCQAPLEYASNSFFPRLSPQKGLCAFILQTQPDEALLACREKREPGDEAIRI